MNWQGSNMSGNLLALQTRKNSHYSANLYEQNFSVVTVASRICQFLRKNAFLLYGSLHSKVYCHHHSYPIQLHGIYLVKAEFTINHSGLQLPCYCPLKPAPSFFKGCHHPGGFLILIELMSHFFTCIANVKSTNTYYT